MNKHIIISEEIKDFFDLRGDELYNITISNNLFDDIKKLIQPNELTFAVIFISLHELESIDSFLTSKYTYTEISYKLIVACSEELLDTIKPDQLQRISEVKISKISSNEFKVIIEKNFVQIEGFYKYKMLKNEDLIRLLDMQRDQDDLINIGKSLSTEKDPDELLKLILMLSKKITGADAGSIYITEELEDGSKQLRFKYSHTFGRDLPMEEYTLPINKNSIAGYVATTSEVLNIPDAYKLSPNDPIKHDTSFDKSTKYRSRSMLVVPMKNHIDQIIGVIQLINSKEDIRGDKSISGNEAFEIRLETPEDFDTKIVPFESRYQSLMESVAGQAAIAIENNRMMKQIQSQFEEFVRASVTAVESRDVATAGHSFRVAEICKEMAKAINRDKDGCYNKINFTETEINELEYAALLHDFGKVYIDINIFKKAKKLFSTEFKNLILKFNYLYRFVELFYAIKEEGTISTRHIHNRTISEMHDITIIKKEKLNKIKKIKDKLTKLNEPTIKGEKPRDTLRNIQEEIMQIECYDIEGEKIELITKDERVNLEIEQGCLNPKEREEIENHVIHSYNFVNNIPWPPEFKKIPEIVLTHHEKLDGSGYPNGIKGKETIFIQSRIMAIADIFDALIASDRPYKKAVSIETALSILKEEAESNKLDKELLDLFLKHKIYEKIDKDSFRARR